MAKRNVGYVCQECGYDAAKWHGKCPGCGQWNTMQEEIISPAARSHGGISLGFSAGTAPLPINEVRLEETERFPTGSAELDRVLGKGAIPGSLVLIAGAPGIGKSSLTLQICGFVALHRGKVLYVTGEESTQQVRMRAERLGAINQNLFVLSETNVNEIEQFVDQVRPQLLVIDSMQTMFKPEITSAPGSVSQVRESAAHLLRIAKGSAIATILVGHVTKDGSLAGPRVLEHIVDTVLFFEGDRNIQYRILRAVKNRFGSTNEIGLFEMHDQGLSDVPDASKLFLSERALETSGSVIIPTVEGSRPLLVELQALVSSSPYIPPRRTADGVDIKRVQLLLAVLEKRVGLHLGTADVYVKVAGGIMLDEPAVDLGLAVALASSFKNCVTEPSAAIFGEVGLGGEVRAVTQVEQRIREAEKMGFKKIVLPKNNLKNLSIQTSLKLIGVETVTHGLEAVLR